MKNIIKFFLVLLIFFLGVFSSNNVCFAKTSIFDEEQHDYSISLIDTTVNVSDSNMYSVSERLTVEHYNNEELCKVVPLVYDGVKRNVFNVKVENTSRKYVIYETKQKGNYLYIYFKNETSLPTETFKISYNYDMGYDFDDQKDMFYFDFIGNNLNQDVKKVTFTINLPSFFNVAKMNVYSKNSDDYHDICALTICGKTIKGETRESLSPSDNLVVSINFDDGFFKVKKSFFNKLPEYTILSIIIVMLILVVILIKDKLIVRYYKQNSSLLNIKKELSSSDNNILKQLNLNPMEISYIVNEGVSEKDVLCMLYYWQEKGYITITKENRNYKIDFNEIFIKGPLYEINLYNYFYDLAQNRTLYLSCINSEFNVISKSAMESMVYDLVHNKKIYNYKFRKHAIIFRKAAEILFSVFIGIVCYKYIGLTDSFFEGTVICYSLTNFLFRFMMNILNYHTSFTSINKFCTIILNIIALISAVFLAKHLPYIEIYNYGRFANIKWQFLCILVGLIVILRLSFNDVPYTKKGLKIRYLLDNYKSEIISIKMDYTLSELYYAIAFDVDPILMRNKDLLNNEFIAYSSVKITINR